MEKEKLRKMITLFYFSLFLVCLILLYFKFRHKENKNILKDENLFDHKNSEDTATEVSSTDINSTESNLNESSEEDENINEDFIKLSNEKEEETPIDIKDKELAGIKVDKKDEKKDEKKLVERKDENNIFELDKKIISPENTLSEENLTAPSYNSNIVLESDNFIPTDHVNILKKYDDGVNKKDDVLSNNASTPLKNDNGFPAFLKKLENFLSCFNTMDPELIVFSAINKFLFAQEKMQNFLSETNNFKELGNQYKKTLEDQTSFDYSRFNFISFSNAVDQLIFIINILARESGIQTFDADDVRINYMTNEYIINFSRKKGNLQTIIDKKFLHKSPSISKRIDFPGNNGIIFYCSKDIRVADNQILKIGKQLFAAKCCVGADINANYLFYKFKDAWYCLDDGEFDIAVHGIQHFGITFWYFEKFNIAN